jgi:hypothetical protein
MKKFILICISLLTINVFGFDCIQSEAQFIGKVTKLSFFYDEMSAYGECSYQIEFRNFQSSGTCPLGIEDAKQAVFKSNFDGVTAKCAYEVTQNGQEISGVLVRLNSGEFKIE